MGVLVLLCVVYALALTASGKSLPKYIVPCSRSEPDLSGCIKKHAIEAIPKLLAGDKDLKLPSLTPYLLPEISLTPSENLKLTLKNCVLTHWDLIQIYGASVDLEKKEFQLKGGAKKSGLDADYTIDGRILILPITGSGKAKIDLDNVTFDYTLHYELVKKGDGKEYMSIGKSTLLLEPEVTHFKFENLFNGDKVLGAEMNKFLNENHKEVAKETNPAFVAITDSIITYILKTILDNVPFDEILLP